MPGKISTLLHRYRQQTGRFVGSEALPKWAYITETGDKRLEINR